MSRNAPRAASCRPPDTGCSSESKVVGFVMRFTESVRTSCVDRKPNSTFWIDEDMGWWVFMLATVHGGIAPTVFGVSRATAIKCAGSCREFELFAAIGKVRPGALS